MNNRKTRVELKGYFKKNAIPTEANFAELIDAAVSLKDDGIYKETDQPLCLEASSANPKAAIQLYEAFTDATPSWAVNLYEPGTSQPAFVLSDHLGGSRLWVKQDGTVTAPGTVNVGSLTSTGAVSAGSISTAGAVSTGALTANGGITVPVSQTLAANGTINANNGLTVASGKTLSANTISPTSGTTVTISNNLSATGSISAAAGLAVTGGALTVGTSPLPQALTVHGLTTVNGGLTVPVSKTLQVDGTLTATTSINANGGLSVPLNKTLQVDGTLTATTTINANGGLTVPVGKTLTVNGTTNTAALTASGLITASAGLSVTGGSLLANTLAPYSDTWITIPNNNNLSVSGTISVFGGLTVQGAPLSVGTSSANPQDLNVYGTIFANGSLTVAAGKTLTVNGTTTANGSITVNGTTTANSSITANGLITANGGLNIASGQTLNTRGTVMMIGNNIDIGPESGVGIRLDKILSQYAIVPTIPATVPFNTGVTIQARVFLYALDDNARIVDFGNGSSSDNIIFYTYADGSLGAQVYRGAVAGTAFKSSSGLLTLGKWIYIAVTVDNTGVIRLYKDGILQSTSSASGANIPNAIQRTSNLIGKSNFAGHPYFSGVIGEISVWSGVRPVTTTSLGGSETGLIAYWPSGAGDACTNAGHLGSLSWSGARYGGWVFDRGNQTNIFTEDWSGTTLQGAWTLWSTSCNPPGFFKDSFGMVRLRGVLTPGTSGTTAFNLPANYRPYVIERLPIAASTTGCYVDIGSNGNVIPYLSGTPTWISLDGITFRVPT